MKAEDFIRHIVFLLRVPFKQKFALFFEVFMNVSKENVVERVILKEIMMQSLKLLKEVYASAKQIANAMNFKLDG